LRKHEEVPRALRKQLDFQGLFCNVAAQNHAGAGMRRREFVASGLAGLAAAPAWAATASDIAVEIDLDGQTYRYDGASGTDLGPYTDPLGQFVQDCIRVNRPQLPLSVFIRPDRGSDRLEVVFELGRLWNAQPANLPKYQARILKGAATVASVDVPAHYWFSRWRWQSAPRPVRANRAQLMDQWLMPRISDTLHPNTKPVPLVAYQPMGLAGLAAYEGATGERPEIGLMTEEQAQYLCTGNSTALAALLAQAEAAGSMPWNLRDEKTNAPVDVLVYAHGTLYGPYTADPYFPKTDAPHHPDPAHEPALSYLPYLLTGDPYHLESLQFTAAWNILCRPWQYRYRTTQVRGEAWSLRNWAQVTKATPANVPKWLLPQSHWQKLLKTYLDHYTRTFVTSTLPPRAIFRTIDWEFGDDRDGLQRGTYVSPWQDEFVAAVLGWMVLMGFSDWRPVFEWQIGSTIARTNGQSGWPRAFCTPYRLVMRANSSVPWVTSWKEAWDLTAAGLKLTVDDPDRLDLKQLFTLPYSRGALTLAKHIGIPNLDASLNWADSELSRAISSRQQLPYKWSLV